MKVKITGTSNPDLQKYVGKEAEVDVINHQIRFPDEKLYDGHASFWARDFDWVSEHDTLVYNREGLEFGILTKSTRRCSMEGCSSERRMVRWPDGKKTWPCVRGLINRPDGHLQIG